MKNLPDFFKGKGGKAALNGAVLLLIAGFALFALNGIFQKNTGAGVKAPDAGTQAEASASASCGDYELGLEQRLEDTLSQMDGVGKVKVMLTLSYGKELTVAQDSVTSGSDISETDSGGGTRTTKTTSADTKNIIIQDSGGSDTPLIVKEARPKVEGVVVVAEGGGSAYVRDAVTKAVGAVLGVAVHKIQVFKMK
ncbi:MAG: stage III sporulation protein AG [Firmicutes bacterium]|nr:stage III sporulation protein AG [Bacillota bacterium]